MTVAVVAGVVLAASVLLWPVGGRVAEVRRVLGGGALEGRNAPEPGPRWAQLRGVWGSDPVELFHDWRRRRRSGSSVSSAVALLEGVAPALEAGLTPSVAVRLSGATLRSSIDPLTARLVAELTETSERGAHVAPVWRSWAGAEGSEELRFVAAAWQLSEVTGAPLADAVRRAVASVHQARERARRVHVAVAGPRATVVVLTVLPLTGPLFGLACGVPPTELYLASPLSSAAAALGLVLIWVGRRWCRRLVESAVSVGGADGAGSWSRR
ncbi:type II secretion system F family protein [Intrasporangium calvum]|uniref:type II secretion system F family protein n=1 Tax=Intrasporangium calvum TaxID=53358 RepID=UPI000DF5C901|nr:type II secretion system F family protein [Intrasporangium calvum]AXG12334.1 hypothetical protein DN585_01810 [Intrasporangium calvum]